MSKEIKGVLPVVLMPYNDQGALDEASFLRQAAHIMTAGCDGFVVGQVSEVLRLTTAERFRVAELCGKASGGHAISVMSTGAESTEAAVEYSRHAESAGVDALLVMHPATMALTDDEMFGYFAAVISSVGIPVLLHHAKSFAKNPLSIDVQVRLMEEFGPVRVQFKPEASPTPPRVSELRDRTGGRARIFEGDGGMMLLDCHRRGLAGTIPATETAEIVRTMWDLLEAGERAKAEPLAHGLSYLMCHMMNSIDFYLAIAKQFLVERGLMSNARIRGPVRFRLDEETRVEVTHTYTRLLALAKELSE